MAYCATIWLPTSPLKSAPFCLHYIKVDPNEPHIILFFSFSFPCET